MEKALEKLEKLIAGYSPGHEDGNLRQLRTLLAAVVGCLKYIKDHAQIDRGCAQRMVRELNELLEKPIRRLPKYYLDLEVQP